MTDQATTVSQLRAPEGGHQGRAGLPVRHAHRGAAVRLTQTGRSGTDLMAWRLGALDRLLDRAASPRERLPDRIGTLARSCLGLDELYQYELPGPDDPVPSFFPVPWVDYRVDHRIDHQVPPDRRGAVAGPVAALVARQCAVVDGILTALDAQGAVVIDYAGLDEHDRSALRAEFDRWIFPTLTPLAVDHGHPFPAISNLSLNLVVRVRRPSTGDTRVARVKVPPLLPRFVPLGDGLRMIPLEEVIAAHLGSLFSGMTIVEHHAFRVTRTAANPSPAAPRDRALGPDQRRPRWFGPAVRLEVAAGMPPDLVETVASGTAVPRSGVFRLSGLLQPGDLLTLLGGAAVGASPSVPARTQMAALSTRTTAPGPGSSTAVAIGGTAVAPVLAPPAGPAVSPAATSPPPPVPSSTDRTTWWKRRPWARDR